MKDPTGFLGIELDGELVSYFKQIPENKLREFFDSLENLELKKLLGCQSAEERLKVQNRAIQIGELRRFFISLLTTKQKSDSI